MPRYCLAGTSCTRTPWRLSPVHHTARLASSSASALQDAAVKWTVAVDAWKASPSADQLVSIQPALDALVTAMATHPVTPDMALQVVNCVRSIHAELGTAKLAPMFAGLLQQCAGPAGEGLAARAEVAPADALALCQLFTGAAEPGAPYTAGRERGASTFFSHAAPGLEACAREAPPAWQRLVLQCLDGFSARTAHVVHQLAMVCAAGVVADVEQHAGHKWEALRICAQLQCAISAHDSQAMSAAAQACCEKAGSTLAERVQHLGCEPAVQVAAWLGLQLASVPDGLFHTAAHAAQCGMARLQAVAHATDALTGEDADAELAPCRAPAHANQVTEHAVQHLLAGAMLMEAAHPALACCAQFWLLRPVVARGEAGTPLLALAARWWALQCSSMVQSGQVPVCDATAAENALRAGINGDAEDAQCSSAAPMRADWPVELPPDVALHCLQEVSRALPGPDSDSVMPALAPSAAAAAIWEVAQSGDTTAKARHMVLRALEFGVIPAVAERQVSAAALAKCLWACASYATHVAHAQSAVGTMALGPTKPSKFLNELSALCKRAVNVQAATAVHSVSAQSSPEATAAHVLALTWSLGVLSVQHDQPAPVVAALGKALAASVSDCATAAQPWSPEQALTASLAMCSMTPAPVQTLGDLTPPLLAGCSEAQLPTTSALDAAWAFSGSAASPRQLWAHATSSSASKAQLQAAVQACAAGRGVSFASSWPACNPVADAALASLAVQLAGEAAFQRVCSAHSSRKHGRQQAQAAAAAAAAESMERSFDSSSRELLATCIPLAQRVLQGEALAVLSALRALCGVPPEGVAPSLIASRVLAAARGLGSPATQVWVHALARDAEAALQYGDTPGAVTSLYSLALLASTREAALHWLADAPPLRDSPVTLQQVQSSIAKSAGVRAAKDAVYTSMQARREAIKAAIQATLAALPAPPQADSSMRVSMTATPGGHAQQMRWHSEPAAQTAEAAWGLTVLPRTAPGVQPAARQAQRTLDRWTEFAPPMWKEAAAQRRKLVQALAGLSPRSGAA